MMSIRFFDQLQQDKKLMLKVMTGVIILVIAFAVFLVKNSAEEDEIIISDIDQNNKQAESNAENPEMGIATESAVTTNSTIFVDVAGAVIRPSVVELQSGSRVFEAVERAGGLSKDADTRDTNLARIVEDGEKIYIPTMKEVEVNGASSHTSGNSGNTEASHSGSSRSSNPASALININTATSEMLQQLTGVGPSTAEKIIQYRNDYGDFKTIEDLKNVSGIGEKTFLKFKNKITV